MKKLLISLLLVVTAFFIGGLQEVKAADTIGVEYVTIEGWGNKLFVSYNGETMLSDALIPEGQISIDLTLSTPQNATSVNILNIDDDVLVTPESYTFGSGYVYDFYIGAVSLTMNEQSEDLVRWYFSHNSARYMIYFEIESPSTLESVGNREYVHFGEYTNVNHITLFADVVTDSFGVSSTIPIEIPENAVDFVVEYNGNTYISNYDPQILTSLNFLLYDDPQELRFDSSEGDVDFTIQGGSTVVTGFPGNVIIYFLTDAKVTSNQFQVVPVAEKFYMHLYDYMGTGLLSNVILVNSTEKINTFTTLAGSTGIPFASIDNAVSINIGYQSAGVAYDNATTYSPKTYTLNPNEEYQFYLNRDSNGLYISTDSTVWTGKWYVRTSTGTYSPSAFIYFQTDKKPVLDGQVAFVSNISNPMSEANIRTYITAIDDYDGDISHLISYDGGTYESNRIANTLVPNQSYTILYSVEDSSGNETQLTVTVLVKDVTGPTFGIATPTRQVSYKDTFNVEGFKTSLLVADNYSTTQNITITVIGNTYTANKSVPGTYQITYQATDQFGNSSTKLITVTVIDNVGPVFSGVSTVVKPVGSVLTASEIIAQVIASDEISGNVSASIQIVTDNYTGNGATLGNYSIIVRATDASGNSTDYTITVQVRDSLPPVFYVKDGYFINVEDTVTLSIGDIITILERTGQLVISSTTNYTVLVNEYTGSEDIEGIYTVSIKFNSTNGTEVIKSVAVNVINTEDPTGTITPDQTITDHIVENWYWYAIGGVVLFLIFSPKKTYKRRG
jgi:hypothetical protein